MAAYSLWLKPSVEKDVKSLPKDVIARVWSRIEALKSDPYPPKVVKLEGAERLYRIRQGDYRIVYDVNSVEKQITIHYVRHRREVYRDL
jgi:mRNA interferase RelE/StbE